MNDLPPRERDVAMVFQSYALYPHMRVYDNLAYALRLRHLPEAEIDRRVREAARSLGIEALLRAQAEASCPAASASAWRSAAPSCASRRCS